MCVVVSTVISVSYPCTLVLSSTVLSNVGACQGSIDGEEGGIYQAEIQYTEQEQHAIRKAMAHLTAGEDVSTKRAAACPPSPPPALFPRVKS